MLNYCSSREHFSLLGVIFSSFGRGLPIVLTAQYPNAVSRQFVKKVKTYNLLILVYGHIFFIFFHDALHKCFTQLSNSCISIGSLFSCLHHINVV